MNNLQEVGAADGAESGVLKPIALSRAANRSVMVESLVPAVAVAGMVAAEAGGATGGMVVASSLWSS